MKKLRSPRSTTARAKPSSGTHPVVASKLSAVVVEDHRDLREGIAEMLEACGWSVRCYDDAGEALAAIRRELPDLVLTDVNAGSLSGPALARELRLDPSTRGVAIVAMSGSVDPTPGMLRLFDRFLPKPVELAGLDEELRGVLASR